MFKTYGLNFIAMTLVGLTAMGAGCSPLARENRLPDPKPWTEVNDPYSNVDQADLEMRNPFQNTPAADRETRPTTNKSKSNQNYMVAVLHTSKGDITINLNAETPKTVANFVKLAKSGYYDGTKFHRVIKGFMNQGGDPLTKDDSKQALWGTGGPGYQFADEIGPDNHNDVGTIAMANAGPNTNGSQFFLNVGVNDFLDEKHTVFGIITEGMEVVNAINGVRTDSFDRPLEPVVITGVSIRE